jgi:hypothetical protein
MAVRLSALATLYTPQKMVLFNKITVSQCSFDMNDACDRPSLEATVKAAEQQAVELTLKRWINPVLENTNAITTL